MRGALAKPRLPGVTYVVVVILVRVRDLDHIRLSSQTIALCPLLASLPAGGRVVTARLREAVRSDERTTLGYRKVSSQTTAAVCPLLLSTN